MTEPTDPTLLDSEITNKIGYILKKYSVYCFMGERASDFDEVKAEQAIQKLIVTKEAEAYKKGYIDGGVQAINKGYADGLINN
ncbi:MAG: hypothetical protein WCJ60_01740 [bacterium]